MEILTIILLILLIVTLIAMCGVLYTIRKDLKEISHSLERIGENLVALNDQLIILFYLTAARDNPNLLNDRPDLEQRVLEAVSRLGQRQLTMLEVNK